MSVRFAACRVEIRADLAGQSVGLVDGLKRADEQGVGIRRSIILPQELVEQIKLARSRWMSSTLVPRAI